MLRHLAKLLCLAIGFAAQWGVMVSTAEIFGPPIPPLAATATYLAVFLLLYFPLARPLADALTYRLENVRHRVRDTMTGTGIADIPMRPSFTPRASVELCRLCGGPGGPICVKCQRLTSH